AGRAAPIFWYYPNDMKPGNPEFLTPKLAVRDGWWKLLVAEDGSEMQLYDLRTDPAETRNLAARHPGVASRLKARVLAWHGSLPLGAGASH
ncbi:MAG: N-acetylgalactosamine-6-sulfatase, partial [Gemmatimonadota bacterium]|nr:N-acetylgalactosamine-6-sulfatase [Gemmatimonadota bacterium]